MCEETDLDFNLLSHIFGPDALIISFHAPQVELYDEDMSLLAEKLKHRHSNVTELSTVLDGDSTAYLPQISPNLRVPSLRITANDDKCFQNIGRLTNLWALDLSFNTSIMVQPSHMKNLQSLVNLKHFDFAFDGGEVFAGGDLRDDEFVHLFQALGKLRELDTSIWDCDWLTATVLVSLGKNCRKLEIVKLFMRDMDLSTMSANNSGDLLFPFSKISHMYGLYGRSTIPLSIEDSSNDDDDDDDEKGNFDEILASHGRNLKMSRCD
ncbi:hypothetical protein K470DRAFT_268097 [Piedraia hortae CBS 480.64]|uniref:Uncharacterized protein n=1 Tax=Piedraia hortae CBS 480.64 TaxID=1314780 RepID=A0A6A7C8W2_9PEZI|nr:hypothetical protein K470DRAFT_268097 [Piedraia hortae CBS 480.64]